MQELVCPVSGALAEPCNKGLWRPRSCGLYEAVEIAWIYLRQNSPQECSGGGIGDKGLSGNRAHHPAEETEGRELSKKDKRMQRRDIRAAGARRAGHLALQVMADLPHRLLPSLLNLPGRIRCRTRTVLLVAHGGALNNPLDRLKLLFQPCLPIFSKYKLRLACRMDNSTKIATTGHKPRMIDSTAAAIKPQKEINCKASTTPWDI